MIFSNTFKARANEANRRHTEMVNGVKKFAYLPQRLKSGQYVWLQTYYAYYHGFMRDGNMHLWSGSPDSFSPFYSAYIDKDDSYRRVDKT
jgi:hypothetical protein